MLRNQIIKSVKTIPLMNSQSMRYLNSTSIVQNNEKSIESFEKLTSIIPKEFSAESNSYVKGKHIDLYAKVLDEGSSYLSAFLWIFLFFPSLAGLGVLTYKDIAKFKIELEKEKRNSY